MSLSEVVRLMVFFFFFTAVLPDLTIIQECLKFFNSAFAENPRPPQRCSLDTNPAPAPGESPVSFASAPYSFLITVCLSISPPSGCFSLSCVSFLFSPRRHLLCNSNSSLPFNHFLSPCTAYHIVALLFILYILPYLFIFSGVSSLLYVSDTLLSLRTFFSLLCNTITVETGEL